eukprot:CAMPEP_0185701172 /NCGR_PEP_ID=MMETSP1164-20130828/8741_1 /TAXON_ID=1104430 /ORGANISM="Chrysoreinhardia sp, Strain CCMP2950" /LENGTH=84 /DNA_ID=CAMNT_0028368173 /DNA_START=5 /DNA_END=259 /DNA_ORIENTATION=-
MAPLPAFSSLEWRLDVEVGRRALMHTAEPSFVLKLNTVAPGATEAASTVLAADAAHMRHIETQLAAAVEELNTTRTSRLMRYIR